MVLLWPSVSTLIVRIVLVALSTTFITLGVALIEVVRVMAATAIRSMKRQKQNDLGLRVPRAAGSWRI